MKEYTVTVNHDCMLSIFAGNAFDELPYRFQPNVKFVIDFTEYSMFCKLVLDADIHCLFQDNRCHGKALGDRSGHLLRRLFYMDVSQASLVELLLAVSAGREASVIVHTFSDECDAKSLSFKDISNELKNLPTEPRTRALRDIKSMMPLNVQLSKHNAELLQYVYYLRTLSWMENPEIINLE